MSEITELEKQFQRVCFRYESGILSLDMCDILPKFWHMSKDELLERLQEKHRKHKAPFNVMKVDDNFISERFEAALDLLIKNGEAKKVYKFELLNFAKGLFGMKKEPTKLLGYRRGNC